MFAGADVWWEPVATLGEALADPQMAATGAFVDLERADGSTMPSVAGPISYDGGSVRVGRPPELGEHTEDVLLSLGYDWERIAELRDEGTLG